MPDACHVHPVTHVLVKPQNAEASSTQTSGAQATSPHGRTYSNFAGRHTSTALSTRHLIIVSIIVCVIGRHRVPLTVAAAA